MRARATILRMLGIPCAAFGGEIVRKPGESPMGRWCTKPFGHPDSCYYEPGEQPLWQLRQQAKGYRMRGSNG